MDIWAWVAARKQQLREQGQLRLASIMDQVPSLVCDMKHEQAEALVPEGLALARGIEDAWVEIFLRHWLMQSRVLHRHQGRANTQECVALLELAHRPEHRGCPQSVCVVQDFANCFGIADGPGYAEERLRVTAEALGQVDPSWPCFRCISVEHADALRDAGDAPAALAFIERQMAAQVAAGEPGAEPDFALERAIARIALGRNEEALSILEETPAPESRGESGRVDWALRTAEALAGLQRYEEAVRVAPSFDRIEAADEREWLLLQERLVLAGARENDEALAITAARIVERHRRDGSDHRGASVALCAARLAAARGARHQADTYLEAAEGFRAVLRKPVAIDAERQETRRRIDEVPPPQVSATDPEHALEALPEDRQARLEALAVALERWPDHDGIVCAYARALYDLELGYAAVQRLERFVEEHPHRFEPLFTLGLLLRDAGEHARLEAVVRSRFHAEDPRGPWLLATSHERASRYEEAAEALRRVLALDPEAEVPKARLCELECRRGHWDPALELANELVASCEPGDRDWDRMVAATALGRWDLVRDSCRRLGIELDDDEGPIAEHWGACRIQTDAGSRVLWAARTGPVTARISSICGPAAPKERESDLVLFDPAPVETQALPDGGRVHTYRELAVLEAGRRWSFTLDGAHPGDERLDALLDALVEFELAFETRSSEAYVLADPDTEAEIPGIYLFCSVPETTDKGALAEALQTATREWPQPLVWIELARAAPNVPDAELARQTALIERFGL